VDLRCEHKLLGVLLEPAPDGVVELKCSSRFCGARAGVVVLHRFSTETGKLIGTSRFRDTPKVERKSNGSSSAIRTA
jgi:hypothetical protein